MVRDLLRGQWKYNPDALQTTFYYLPDSMRIDPQNFIVRERDRHVNRIALLKFIRANLADKDWDAFVEIYAIPSGVVIGPPGVQPEKEEEYQKAASDIADGGSGYLPNGSDYKPNHMPRGNDPFRPRLDYLSEKLVLAGTGGLLTMLAQSGSGTLAGGAHMEAFRSIARAEAQRHIEMFEREIGVPGKVSEHPAPMPIASKARVEGETPVDQPDCGIDILAGSTENEGSDGENVGVVGAGSERSSTPATFNATLS